MNISAKNVDYKLLNQKVKEAPGDICIDDCCGHRFIGANLKDKYVKINGIPGNALGAYLDGATIEVNGNVQDAVGDTMNEGRLIIHGSAGDALGYAMRGGAIYVKDDAGYRTGIHMKEYEDKKPVIVVGGKTGSFLGEYLAGGIIVVLGLDADKVPVGNFTGTGMHGGKIFVRTEKEIVGLPAQVISKDASDEDLEEISVYIEEFAEKFGLDAKKIMKSQFQVLTPDAKNPYHQLYAAN